MFEIEVGAAAVPCGISRLALDTMSEQRLAGGPAYVWFYLGQRRRIETMARDKLREMPAGLDGLVGTLNIWASDLDHVPPSLGSADHRRPDRLLTA